jgi:uncharacterized RDD family membrane protein YckC
VEQVGAREQVQYAGLGWRFAAIAVDTVVLFFLLVVIFAVLAAAGALDLKDPAFSGGIDLQRTAPVWVYAITYGLIFVYYTLFEALTAASVGKLVFRMRVTMDDGTRPSGLAVVIRNLIRLPEVLFWYIPSGISCLANAKNKRLGDLAAKTAVVRRGGAPAGSASPGATPSWRGGAPLPPAPPLGQAPGAPGLAPAAPAPPSAFAPAAPTAPGASEALAGLKTAALAVRGAHLNYLRFSEVELAKGAGGAAGEAADQPIGEAADQPGAQPEPEYSPEYAAAWYTLADAVIAMQQAHAAAIAAASREGTTLQAVCADQPDLIYLFRELEPFFTAGSDEQVHDAYMRVARGETTA